MGRTTWQRFAATHDVELRRAAVCGLFVATCLFLFFITSSAQGDTQQTVEARFLQRTLSGYLGPFRRIGFTSGPCTDPAALQVRPPEDEEEEVDYLAHTHQKEKVKPTSHAPLTAAEQTTVKFAKTLNMGIVNRKERNLPEVNIAADSCDWSSILHTYSSGIADGTGESLRALSAVAASQPHRHKFKTFHPLFSVTAGEATTAAHRMPRSSTLDDDDDNADVVRGEHTKVFIDAAVAATKTDDGAFGHLLRAANNAAHEGPLLKPATKGPERKKKNAAKGVEVDAAVDVIRMVALFVPDETVRKSDSVENSARNRLLEHGEVLVACVAPEYHKLSRLARAAAAAIAASRAAEQHIFQRNRDPATAGTIDVAIVMPQTHVAPNTEEADAAVGHKAIEFDANGNKVWNRQERTASPAQNTRAVPGGVEEDETATIAAELTRTALLPLAVVHRHMKYEPARQALVTTAWEAGPLIVSVPLNAGRTTPKLAAGGGVVNVWEGRKKIAFAAFCDIKTRGLVEFCPTCPGAEYLQNPF